MARTGTQFAKLTGDFSSINVYATWQLLSQDKDSRSSTIRLREYLTYSSSGTYSSSYSTFKLNGKTVKSGSYSYSSKGDHLLGYNDITVEHNEDGTFPDTKLTAYAYSFHFTGKPSETVILTSEDIPDIEVASTIREIRDYILDTKNGVPLGIILDMNLLEASIYDAELGQPHTTMLDVNINGNSYHLFDVIPTDLVSVYFDQSEFQTVGGTDPEHSITPILFPLSWQEICSLIPNTTTIPIDFILTTYNYGSPMATTITTYNFEVTKANFDWNPYLSADNKTIELVGKDKTFIENFSSLLFNSNISKSLNGATVKSFKYIQTKYSYDISDISNPTIVVNSLTQNNSAEPNFLYTDIGTSDEQILKVGYKATIVDSRGFETTSDEILVPSEEYPVISYEQPKLINATVERPEQTAPYVDVSISGSFWNDSFGAIQNGLTLQYHYKLSTANDYTDWATLEPKINEDGTFSYNGTLGSEDAPLIPSDTSAVFEIKVADSTLSEYIIKDITIPKGKSMFDLGEEYLSINGELCIKDEEVPCFKEVESNTTSRTVQLYDSNMKSVYPLQEKVPITISGLPNGSTYACFYIPSLSMCWCAIYLTGKSFATGERHTIGTVASEYRPARRTALAMDGLQDYAEVLKASITSTGEISFTTSADKVSSDDMYISGCWCLE